MRTIIENLTANHLLTLVVGSNSESLSLDTLGSKEAYLIKRVHMGLASTSAAPSVAAAGQYRFEISVCTGVRVSPTHPLQVEDLVAVAGRSGGALAAKDIEFDPAIIPVGRVLPSNNIFVTGTTNNINNAATTVIQFRIEYDIVRLTLSEVNEFLTR